MSNEEFQKLVLDKLTILEKGQNELKTDMKYIKDKVRIIEEQTKTLSEFRHTVIESAKEFSKKIKSTIFICNFNYMENI